MTRAVLAGTAAVAVSAGAGCSTSPPSPSAPTTATTTEATTATGPQSPRPTPAEGTAGVWELTDPASVSPVHEQVEIGVSRLECSSGETGEIAEPTVTWEEDRVLIRADVEPLPFGEAHTCPGNDAVPVTVRLPGPLGGRSLVDEACLSGPATDTTLCDDAVRWRSPARDASAEVPDWTAPADYAFTVNSACGLRPFFGTYAVTVADGRIASVESPEPAGENVGRIDPEITPTLDDMLASARAALADGGTAEVSVDDAGVPRWISIDPMPDAIDDEGCYTITGYRAG